MGKDKCQMSNVKCQNYKKILLMRLDRVGDVVLSTPAIKATRDAYPDSYIVFMVRPHAYDIIRGNPYVDEVIACDKEKGVRGFFGIWRLAMRVRRYAFDLAVVLHPTTRSHLIVFLSGIAERIGYDKKAGWLLTRQVPHTKQFGLRHERDYALDLLRYARIEAKECLLHVPIHHEREVTVDAFFRRNNIAHGERVIVIHPGASCPSKRWPPERFAQVADACAEKYRARIVIIAGPEDTSCGRKVALLMQRDHVDLSGMTVIGDLASIFKRAQLFISNDSGPVHIASAVGVPVISIFGRSDRGLSPARWGPTGERDIALHKDVGCDVCLAHNCARGFECLRAITVDDVLAAAAKILG